LLGGAHLCLERLDLAQQELAHVLDVRHAGVPRRKERELLLVHHHLPLQLGMPGLKTRPNLGTAGAVTKHESAIFGEVNFNWSGESK